MEDYYEEYEDYEIGDISEESLIYDTSPFGADISAKSVYDECMEPTVYSAVDQVIWLLFSCLLFRILTQLGNHDVYHSKPLCHFVSFVSGLIGLFSVVGPNALYTSILGVATYWCLVSCAKRSFASSTYKIIVGGLLIYLVAREYYNVLPESWEQVRGVQMIMVMKTLSLSYEIFDGRRKEIPPLLDYVGYMFCPATVVFGPWISFNSYANAFENGRWGIGWGIRVFATSILSVVCLGFSSCWVYWFFAGINLSWVIAMRDALSVRFSHYFVCLMSEVTCTLCGFYSDDGVSVEVTKPWKIEFPRSLVEVVINWNISMHRWLRHHVFRPSKQLGRFRSVLLTFLVSSMLHGMNFNLTMVLLSLGFYTYVEYTLREKLGNIFDACILSRACPPDCRHTYKYPNVGVIAVNLFFGFWAYFHLAYLGIMMDKSQVEDETPSEGFLNFISNGLKRWDDLGYASHWVMAIVSIGNLVI
ncbi:Protein-serine O-palmitoleoyltransferase porcupine [Orchesella cincta]|uniref:Protein-serine O-palmitoleoyltransferase porcupine n=1 Tax=Orchesella cincta TaxID=48709 RepID=A0A1D2MRN2_ORCCI|nr:Protein-serine O-palmitoleoyltransferase porcupine [Orchesella cincta]